MRPLVPKGILSVRQTGIGHSSFSSGVSSFGLELIFETIIPVQVTTTTQRYIPIPKSQGMKQLMAGGGVALIGTTLVPLLSGLFG